VVCAFDIDLQRLRQRLKNTNAVKSEVNLGSELQKDSENTVSDIVNSVSAFDPEQYRHHHPKTP
jgi:hypothetical protein